MALVYYTDAANGSDDNGGSSDGHSADASGTAGATDGTTTVDLSGDTPDLSGVAAGDVIRINGETNGIKGTDLFEIASADDGADTVTVTGNTPGTADPVTWAIGGALLTIDRAMNAIEAGDTVWIQSGTDYSETVTLDTAGGSTAWMILEGYTTTTGDGGKATIDGGSSRTNGITTSLGAAAYRFNNIIIENCLGDGWNGVNTDRIVFDNCEFNLNGGNGIDADNEIVFVGCSATDNTIDGFSCDTTMVAVNCASHSNTQQGYDVVLGGMTIYNCISSYNGKGAIQGKGNTNFGAASVFNCTVDGNGDTSDDGFKATSDDDPIVLVNNIFYDCSDGIDGNTSPHAGSQIGLNNLVNANGTAYRNWNPTSTDVTSAPGFTAEGSQDYTLAAGSAALDAGADVSGSSSPGMDIGAHQAAGAAGGGVGVIVGG